VLILTRTVGETITIGDNIRIHILAIKGTQVRLGIEAPKNMLVLREEIVAIAPDEPVRET